MKTYQLKPQQFNRNKTPKCRMCQKAIPPSGVLSLAAAWGRDEMGTVPQFHSNRCAIQFAYMMLEYLDNGDAFAPTEA